MGQTACGHEPITFKNTPGPTHGETAYTADAKNGQSSATYEAGTNRVSEGTYPGNYDRSESSPPKIGYHPQPGSSDKSEREPNPNQGLPPSAPLPSTPEANPGALALAWDLPCVKQDLNSANAIIGGGRHQIAAGNFSKLSLSLSGSVCQPANTPRDIVFVIDVTGSMGPNPQNPQDNQFNHDPLVNNTCGRLEAIRSVLNMLPKDGTARVSLLTFNTDVVKRANGFFFNEQDLFNNLDPSNHGRKIADIVCRAEGGTHYDAPLNGAKELLAKARPDAQKEVFFITDGEPELGSDGSQEAQNLRQLGTLITGIMLQGDEHKMANQIVSRDPHGQPFIRKVEQARELAAALADLTINHLTKVELRYKPASTAVWWTADVSQELREFAFRLPPINFDLTLDSLFDVILDAQDSRGRHATVRGQIEAVRY